MIQNVCNFRNRVRFFATSFANKFITWAWQIIWMHQPCRIGNIRRVILLALSVTNEETSTPPFSSTLALWSLNTFFRYSAVCGLPVVSTLATKFCIILVLMADSFGIVEHPCFTRVQERFWTSFLPFDLFSSNNSCPVSRLRVGMLNPALKTHPDPRTRHYQPDERRGRKH